MSARMRRSAVLLASLAVLVLGAGCRAEAVRTEQPLLADECRDGILVLDAYLRWYEEMGRRLIEQPGSLTEQERTQFLAVGRALRKVSRGLNVAVGNFPAGEGEVDSE